MNRRIASFIERLIKYVLAIIVAVIFIFPLYWLGISSIKPDVEILSRNPTLIPLNVTWENYVTLFGLAPGQYAFHKYIFNSLIVALGVTIITLLISLPSGYSLARFRYKGKILLSRLILFAYLVSPAILLISYFYILNALKLIDNLIGLIVIYPTFTIPFAVWILRAFFESIPPEFEEAAMVDGASRLGAFVRVVLPISGPVLGTITIYSFITSWVEYMFAFTIISSEELKTVPVAVAHSIATYHVEWGLLTAAGFISALPVLILFMPLTKYLIRGIMTGVEVKA